QPHGADQQGANPCREREIDHVPGALANPESRARIAPGPECALVKPLDGVGIGGRFGGNGGGEVGHRKPGSPDITPRRQRPSGSGGPARVPRTGPPPPPPQPPPSPTFLLI